MFDLNGLDMDRLVGADIRIVGIGSSGINAINRMIDEGLSGVEFIGINTDLQSLSRSKAKTNLQIGEKITFGLGAGGNVEKGLQAIEYAKDDILKLLEGADLVFVTTGLGGGTGTPASWKVAEYARELGCLTVAVVTKPFGFEGNKKMKIATEGLDILRQKSDTVISIPNDRLLQITSHNVPLKNIFKLADNVLKNGVESIISIVDTAALVNVDFADLRTVLQDSGNAMIGIGEAEGNDATIKAVEMALNSFLLELPFEGARRVLVFVSGPQNLGILEVNKAMQLLYEKADPDANIIWGYGIDENETGKVKVTVIAAGLGFEAEKQKVTSKPKAGFVEKLNRKIETQKKLDSSDLDIPAFLRRR
jgi:cell division protein FtsZ